MSESEKSSVDVSTITDVRGFEDFLRSVGFSKSRAKTLASRGWVSTETQPNGMTLVRAKEMLAQVAREDDQNEFV
jgi:hypothetical protein